MNIQSIKVGNSPASYLIQLEYHEAMQLGQWLEHRRNQCDYCDSSYDLEILLRKIKNGNLD